MAIAKMNLDLTFLGVSREGRITCVKCKAQKPSAQQAKTGEAQPLYRADVHPQGVSCDCCGLPLATV